ncbi:mRNA 3'-end-processing protein RNA14 [Favolaschia claudopus]|uniref:mRNA 3'-end-processing protein RNA14 n=1 Tax=Favolaschia claudopus TaxID=2862362 RepID=A0AAV9ZM34_9AGAR
MFETLPEATIKIQASPADESFPPPSDFDALKARLKESPHDPESWKRFIDVAESSGNGFQIREAYEALLKQYPNTASAQIAYLKHVLNRRVSMTTDVEQLLKRFLRTSPSVELWRFYLDYVLRVNVTPSPTTRETVRKSYDYALSRIGYDRDSGSAIWASYIQFLRNAPEGSTWDNQQKMDAIRKAQNQAVQLPLDNVDQLWAQLESYETSLNKTTAKKIMTDLSPAHMQAHTVLRQLNIHLQGLGTSNTNGIFLPAPPTFSATERQLIGRWKSYLKWEEGNPLELEEKDRATLVARVEHAYRKAVSYYSEIWFMAYTWCTSVGRNAEALSFLRSGLEANPESFVLTYAYVELLEKTELKKDQRDFSAVHSVYERFIGGLRAHLARLTELAAQLDATGKASTEEPKDENGSLEAIRTNPGTTAPDLNSRYQAELIERKRHYANAWIAYMRFARRTQGQTTCRETFSKARKDEYVGWEVYEAAALTEYRCNSEDGRLVASRIFETGMKKFGTDASYVLSHLNFLLTVNDENNARALFEGVIGTFTPAKAKLIWERWSRSQYQYDDLEAALEIERRMAETYPGDTPIKRFAQRHTYHQTDAIAAVDLGVMKNKKKSVANPGTFANHSSYPPLDRNDPLVASTRNTVSVKLNEDGPAANPSVPNSNNKRPLPPPECIPTAYKRHRPDERERRRSPPPPPRRDRPKEEKPIGLPAVLSWFVTQLPPPETFDGPVFDTDNLMDTIRTAVIPSSTRHVRSPPPPPQKYRSAGSGRHSPDYGPYQGPQSGPLRGRRYP